MATARSMHMAASYWGFVLMSIHLGLHWGMVMEVFMEYTAMMGFWAFAGYYMAKILKRPIKRL